MDTDQSREHLKQIIETQSELALAGFDLQAFMDKIVERMLSLTPATGSVVELAEGTEIVYKATSGSVAPFVGVRLQMGNSLTGLCLRDREIKISTDTTNDPRVDLAACKRVGAASMVLVPLMKSGEPLGVLKVLSNQPNAFSASDVSTLQLMAGLLSGALAQQMEMEQRKRLEEELKTQNAKVQEATRLKSEFLANMSHEIRTPLNAIIGFTDILLRREQTAQNHCFLENIRDAGHGLLALINDILDFSKIEAGKMTIEMVDFDLEHVVHGAIQIMTQQCQNKGLRLVKTFGPGVPPCVIGDPARLRQILINLLGNAVKFSSEGTVALDVSCVNGDADGSVVLRFSVADEGVGLSPEESAKLFQPFVQADGSTTRKFGGTGLGLSICKHLVELMGGEIGIESTKGKGATFWFTLPYERGSAASPSRSSSGSKQSDLHSFKPALILVADDHSANQMVAELQLHELGLSAHIVSTGVEAIEAMREHSFGAILMDCHMPEMDGFEAAREIRKLESATTRRTPIIAMTASAMTGDKERCIEAGMDDYVTKPVELKQLSAVLGRWLPLNDATPTQTATTSGDTNGDASNKSSEPLVLDTATLVENFGELVVCKLLEKLISTTDEVMELIDDAVEAEDRNALFALSHKLVGSCGTLRAWELYSLSENLNIVAHTASWNALQEVCREARSAYARLRAASEAFIKAPRESV